MTTAISSNRNSNSKVGACLLALTLASLALPICAATGPAVNGRAVLPQLGENSIYRLEGTWQLYWNIAADCLFAAGLGVPPNETSASIPAHNEASAIPAHCPRQAQKSAAQQALSETAQQTVDGAGDTAATINAVPADSLGPVALPKPIEIRVPHIWNSYTGGGKMEGGSGFGSYRLHITLSDPPPKNLALKFYDAATAARIWFNGQELGGSGHPGRPGNPQSAQPHYRPQIYTLPQPLIENELIIEVSNYIHSKGGMWEPPEIGLASAVAAADKRRLFVDFFMLGGILIMGGYHLGLFMVRPKDKAALFFALFCVLILVRILLTGERIGVRLWPAIPFDLFQMLEYMTVYIAAPVFYAFLSRIYPEELRRSFFIWTLIGLGLCILTVLFTPLKVYSRTLIPYQLLVTAMSLFGLYYLAIAWQRGRPGARAALAGFVVFIATVMADFLDSNNVLYSGNIAPAGLFIFIISQAYLLSASYARAYQEVEQLSADLKTKNRIIAYQAGHDALTGLPNRHTLDEHSGEIIHRMHKAKKGFGVFFLDLDQFKKINDSFGHSFGDRVLLAVSQRLIRAATYQDMVIRSGGDEFIFLSLSAPDRAEMLRLAEEVMRCFEAPFNVDGRQLALTASMGMAFYPEHGETMADLVRNADLAVYTAKDSGKNRFKIFQPSESGRARERLHLENYLRQSLRADRFFLNFQPKFALQTEQIAGHEALLRLRDEDGQLISAEEFIPVTEDQGLIVQLGDWVLKEAMRQNAALGPAKQWTMAVNVSPRQFLEEDYIKRLETIIQESDMPPEFLEIELTEGLLMRNPGRVVEHLKVIRDWGVKLAIDDFGTGFSSLSYLRNMPVDTIKIDRSFVQGLPHEQSGVAIVRSILALAKDLGLQVVAEGVEQAEQAAFLRQAGCDYAQGFYFETHVDSISDLEKVYS